MTRKIYRTANGKMVDLGALQLQNENVRAVGNMGVNARGDLIDGQNKSINSRNQQVAKQYKRQINSNVSGDTVYSSKQQMTAAMDAAAAQPQPVAEKPKTSATPEPTPVVTAGAGSGGLAAAIARAREVKQETLPPAPSRNTGPVKI